METTFSLRGCSTRSATAREMKPWQQLDCWEQAPRPSQTTTSTWVRIPLRQPRTWSMRRDLAIRHFYNSNGLLSAFVNNVVDEVQIPGLSGGDPATWGIPSMNFASGPAGTTKNIWSSFGDLGGDGPYVVTDPTWQIVDNVSWQKGKHSLRFGFEYNRQTFNQLGNQFSRGQFSASRLPLHSIRYGTFRRRRPRRLAPRQPLSVNGRRGCGERELRAQRRRRIYR